MGFTVDIELTNRCNASCHFCPRDQTPHQGLMSTEIFDQALARALEFRDVAAEVYHTGLSVSLCGLGEPLLNRHAAEFTRQVRDAGLDVHMSSNAALLDERRARDLLDAGLQQIYINVGDRDEAYEDVYKLPFEKTRANVVRFAEMAEGRCEVFIVLVNYRRDPDHLAAMRAYWKSQGLSAFHEFEIMNRGGALFVDHMQFEALPQLAEARTLLHDNSRPPVCGAPFAWLFIGYDGQYYLCCSDWKKEVPLGSVFDKSLVDVTRAKLQHVLDRESVCRTCNLDPINQLTEELRAIADGQADAAAGEQLLDSLKSGSVAIFDALEMLQPGVADEALRAVSRRRPSIPVTAV